MFRKPLLKISLVLTVAMLIIASACSRPIQDLNDSLISRNESFNLEPVWSELSSVPDSVTIGVHSLTASLDPFRWQEDASACCMGLIYQPLMQRDKNTGELILVLASEVEQLDARKYIVTLWDDIHDHTLAPITASDVAFSYIKSKGSRDFPSLSFVERISVIDRYRFQVEMNTDSFYQFGVAMSQINVVNLTTYLSDDQPDKTMAGTGPYLIRSFDPQNRLELDVYKDYWGSRLSSAPKTTGWYWHAQNISHICFQRIDSSRIMKVALDTGAIDIAENINEDNTEFFENDPDYKVWELASTSTYTLQFNQAESVSPCADINLRKAICHAIDADGIIRQLGGDKLKSTTWGAVTLNDYLLKWESNDYYSFDPDAAATYLDASGYDTELPLNIICENTEESILIAQLIQRYLLAIGVETELSICEKTKFQVIEYNRDLWDLKLLMVDAECIPDFSVDAFSTAVRRDGLNNCFFSDDKLQELIESTSIIPGYETAELAAVYDYIASGQCAYTTYEDNTKLQELLKESNSGKGHSITDLTELQEYIDSNYYGYALFSNINYNVTSADITDFPINVQLCVFPNACTYSDSYHNKLTGGNSNG